MERTFRLKWSNKRKEGGTLERKVVEQVSKIITSSVTVEELEEIEKVIQEAKRDIAIEAPQGYWENKTPCWEMCSCPSSVRNECPSFRMRCQPCWEMEGTYCKLEDQGATGRDISICRICRVYKKYGNGEPIEIKLFGHGMDSRF
jgi:hypothetical protein